MTRLKRTVGCGRELSVRGPCVDLNKARPVAGCYRGKVGPTSSCFVLGERKILRARGNPIRSRTIRREPCRIRCGRLSRVARIQGSYKQTYFGNDATENHRASMILFSLFAKNHWLAILTHRMFFLILVCREASVAAARSGSASKREGIRLQ